MIILPKYFVIFFHQLNVKAGVLAVAFGEYYAEIWRPRK